MKRSLLLNTFIYCLSAHQAYGMEPEGPSVDISQYSRHALMSLAVYGDGYKGAKKARKKLESSGYICEKRVVVPASPVIIEAWKRSDEKKPIFAIRGTNVQRNGITCSNILSDLYIPNYIFNKSGAFYDDFKNFCKEEVHGWIRNNLITKEWSSWKMLCMDYLIPDPSKHNIFNQCMISNDLGLFKIPKHNPTLTLGSTLLYGAGVGTIFISAPYSILGGVVVGGVTYGAGKVAECMETSEEKAFFTDAQAVVTEVNKLVESYNNGPYDLTAHSRAGLYANMAGWRASKAPDEIVTFNTPGGAEKIMTEHEKRLTGFWQVQDPTYWGVRPKAINITRRHGIIGCYGGDDATRTSVPIEDYNDKHGPKDVREYLMANHSMLYLANDLLKLQGESLELNVK